MAATSPALSNLEHSSVAHVASEVSFVVPRSADQLCDELLDHMLDCDLCLNRKEQNCSVHNHYQSKLALAGRPQRGIVFAI
jgi:hypothetical protein